MLAAPVLYIAALALLALVAPAVTAGPGGAVAAVARAWAAARGHRGALAATVGLIVVTSQLGSVVLLSLARALRVGGADNPVVLVVLDAGAAAMLAGGALLIALAGVVVYRALAK